MQGRISSQDKQHEKAEQKKHPSTSSYLDFILQSKKHKENNFRIESKNEKVLRVSEIIKMTIGSGVPILITGKKGVGKSSLAKKVSHAERSILNGEECLIECYDFSNAQKSLKSFFDAKEIDIHSLSSLVLFEITELSLANQEELLNILRTCCGKNHPRIIVTSSKNIMEQVQRGLFKQDLYYRLYVLHVELPELQERQEDLFSLVKETLEEINCNKEPLLVYQEVLNLYSKGRLSWDDNIIGLKNFLQNKLDPNAKKEVKIKQKVAIRNERQEADSRHETQDTWLKKIPEGMTLKELETHYILEVLSEFQNNRTHTAKALGISLRTLRNKINQYRAEGYKVS